MPSTAPAVVTTAAVCGSLWVSTPPTIAAGGVVSSGMASSSSAWRRRPRPGADTTVRGRLDQAPIRSRARPRPWPRPVPRAATGPGNDTLVDPSEGQAARKPPALVSLPNSPGSGVRPPRGTGPDILTVRVVNDAPRSALAEGHVGGVEHDLGAEVAAHGPADHPPREGVHDDGQEQEPRPDRACRRCRRPKAPRAHRRGGRDPPGRRRAGRARPGPWRGGRVGGSPRRSRRLASAARRARRPRAARRGRAASAPAPRAIHPAADGLRARLELARQRLHAPPRPTQDHDPGAEPRRSGRSRPRHPRTPPPPAKERPSGRGNSELARFGSRSGRPVTSAFSYSSWVEVEPSGSSSQSGIRSRASISSTVGRGRTTAQRSPRTSTSGTSGRALYSDAITAP